MKKHLTYRGRNLGFTLIELMVVISIISMLSSVVLASVTAARVKAKQAASQTFSKHLMTAYYDDAVAIWNFDEAVSSIPDTSGNNRNYSTVPVGMSRSSTERPINRGSSLYFPGGVGLAGTAFPAVSIPEGTVSFWINTSRTNNGEQYIISSVGQIEISTSYYYGFEQQIIYTYIHNPWTYKSLSLPFDGKWHHIVLTYKNGIGSEFYIDGKSVEKTTAYTITGAGVINIGMRPESGGAYYNGYLDEFMIFKKSMIASEIEHLYAEGLKTHTLATK